MKLTHFPPLLAGLCSLVLSSCVAVPLLGEGGSGEIDLTQFPPAAEQVEIPAERGETMRGVYVPADDPLAPVVLHLLRSSDSVTNGAEHVLLGELAAMGVSSLMVDYRGVGASGGERSSAHLRSDALALYDEAVRRAGGDESRVFLRGTSVGSLAAAQILQSGARPAGVSLVVPVRSETVIANYLKKQRLNGFLRFFATLPFHNPVDVDILRELRDVDVPLLVHAALKDSYLPADERERMRGVVEQAGGHFVPVPGIHWDVALQSRWLFPAERALYRSAAAPSVALTQED